MATAAAGVGGATAVVAVDEVAALVLVLLVDWSVLVAAPAESNFALLDGSLHP